MTNKKNICYINKTIKLKWRFYLNDLIKNIDIEYLEDNTKHGLFDPGLITDESQQKIGNRINQILASIDN